MAQKRKAQEAFGKHKTQQGTQLSAFAAATLARQNKTEPEPLPEDHTADDQDVSVSPDSDAGRNGISIDGGLAIANLIDNGDGPQPIHSRPTTPKLLSTWQPGTGHVLYNHDEDDCVINLPKDETATFYGEYDIEVISGTVTIYGALLHAKAGKKRTYAPNVHAIPPIIARSDAVVRISSVRSSLRRLETMNPAFRNLWPSDSKRSFQFVSRTDDTTLPKYLDSITLDRETEGFVSTVMPSMDVRAKKIAFTVGGKSTGKSTMNRFLVNAALRRHSPCYYLDIDPGQPEFSPQGQISLVRVHTPILGPAFAHFAAADSKDYELVKCHSIAANNFKDDPEHYVACVKDLFSLWQSQFSRQALIINTCGWVSGLGADILVQLTAHIQPSVLLFLEPLEVELIQELENQIHGVFRTHRVSRRPPKPALRSPAELRSMQMMAYFHSRPRGKFSKTPISAMRPWIVSYSSEAKAGIRAIVCYGQAPHPAFLSEVLDGSIVAIVVLDEDHATTDSDQEATNNTSTITLPANLARTPDPSNLPYIPPTAQGTTAPLDPQRSHCVGLALVRAIDATTQTLHLTTPLPASQIAALESQAVVLVRGGYEAPEWAYLEDLYLRSNSVGVSGGGSEIVERPWVSARRETGVGVGVEGAVWRLRHPPVAASMTSGGGGGGGGAGSGGRQ